MPKGYIIVHAEMHDRDACPPHALRNDDIAKTFGGSCLIRGGAGEVLEGETHARHAVIEFPSDEFPSDEAAPAWCIAPESWCIAPEPWCIAPEPWCIAPEPWCIAPDYRDNPKIRQANADSVFMVAAGT